MSSSGRVGSWRTSVRGRRWCVGKNAPGQPSWSWWEETTCFPANMHVHSKNFDFNIPWPGNNATLAVLRDHLAAHTHLHSFAIVSAGAVMKDDHATCMSPLLLFPLSHLLPVTAYGLTPRSSIVLVPHDSPLPRDAPSDEQRATIYIQSELDSVRNLVPQVQAFLAALTPPSQTPPSAQDHARLEESLLQCLLRLDAIHTDTARAQRRTAVKEAQQLLDSIDAAWAAE